MLSCNLIKLWPSLAFNQGFSLVINLKILHHRKSLTLLQSSCKQQLPKPGRHMHWEDLREDVLPVSKLAHLPNKLRLAKSQPWVIFGQLQLAAIPATLL